jgi:hypothetical protein
MSQFLETQGLAMLPTMEKKDMRFMEGKLDRSLMANCSNSFNQNAERQGYQEIR